MALVTTISDDALQLAYQQRLESAKKSAKNGVVKQALDRLETELQTAVDSIASTKAELDRVRDNPVKIQHILSQCKSLESRVELLHEAVDRVLPADGSAPATSLLTAFVSGAASSKLRAAAQSGSVKHIEQLLAEQQRWPRYMVMQSCDEPDPGRNATALLLASENGHLECVRILLESGANPNLSDDDQHSPLHVAKTQDIARLLLMHNADPYALDAMCRTPYMVHSTNRMVGGKNPVVRAFDSKAVQIQRKEAEEVHRERNMTDSERKARSDAAAAAAAATAAAEATQKRREKADFLYARAQGHKAVKQYEEAHQDLVDALVHDPEHAMARRTLTDLRSSGHLRSRNHVEVSAGSTRKRHPDDDPDDKSRSSNGNLVQMTSLRSSSFRQSGGLDAVARGSAITRRPLPPATSRHDPVAPLSPRLLRTVTTRPHTVRTKMSVLNQHRNRSIMSKIMAIGHIQACVTRLGANNRNSIHDPAIAPLPTSSGDPVATTTTSTQNSAPQMQTPGLRISTSGTIPTLPKIGAR